MTMAYKCRKCGYIVRDKEKTALNVDRISKKINLKEYANILFC